MFKNPIFLCSSLSPPSCLLLPGLGLPAPGLALVCRPLHPLPLGLGLPAGLQLGHGAALGPPLAGHLLALVHWRHDEVVVGSAVQRRLRGGWGDAEQQTWRTPTRRRHLGFGETLLGRQI